jgi:hypothetical protein
MLSAHTRIHARRRRAAAAAGATCRRAGWGRAQLTKGISGILGQYAPADALSELEQTTGQ